MPKTEVKATDSHSFAVVAVGASAGGLEAFSQFLHALPRNTGMAFVFIQHLDPKHHSMLSELLAKTTSMSVLEAKSGTKVKPNHIYVIPPNVNMEIRGHRLQLTTRAAAPTLHAPIDMFMRSLAEDQDQRAIGVVLSGTASDGTRGLAAIKAEGGITFAQDEQSATMHSFDSLSSKLVTVPVCFFSLHFAAPFPQSVHSRSWTDKFISLENGELYMSKCAPSC